MKTKFGEVSDKQAMSYSAASSAVNTKVCLACGRRLTPFIGDYQGIACSRACYEKLKRMNS